MKPARYLAALSMAALFTLSLTNASTVSESDPQLGGIGYRWTILLGENDTASFSRHVGAWAWEDSSLFSAGETPVGWTHNSEWVALTLQVPSMVTLRLQNAAGVPNATPANPSGIAPDNLYPGMTIYAGWDNDPAPQAFADPNGGPPPDNLHSYVNRGDIAWAEDTHYFAHLEPNGTHMVQSTLFLPAGAYTIALGGRSVSTTSEPRQGYLATFSTAPVPEPGCALLLFSAGIGLLGRRRPSAF